MIVDGDVRKRSVRDYFDHDAADYAHAYTAGGGDTRSATFLERRALTLQALQQPIGRTLDIGAGPGVFTAALVEQGSRCWVVDVSYEMLAIGRRQLSAPVLENSAFGVADIDRLPFADGAFDTVLCIGVLQYLDEVEHALGELARVTRRGGQVIVSFPNQRSPLTVLHQLAVKSARMGASALRSAGIDVDASRKRLTFREDLPNRAFNHRQLARWSSRVGLEVDFVTYHLLLFPFVAPGVRTVAGLWNQFVATRHPGGAFASWGREGIMRLRRS